MIKVKILAAIVGATLIPVVTYAAIQTPPLSANFVDNQDGTVTQLSTGLIWKRCAEGQFWDGSAKNCLYAPTVRNYQSSKSINKFAGYSDWRLPTISEFETIIDRTKSEPALVDLIAFPSLYFSNAYWTSTYAVNGSSSHNCNGVSWVIDFKYGLSNIDCEYDLLHSNTPRKYFVRLVRGGRSFDSQLENAVYDDLQKTLVIKDVKIGDMHYRMSFQTNDLSMFYVTSIYQLPLSTDTTNSAYYDSKSKSLVIKRVQAFQTFYSVTFGELGGQSYILSSASLIKG